METKQRNKSKRICFDPPRDSQSDHKELFQTPNLWAHNALFTHSGTYPRITNAVLPH